MADTAGCVNKNYEIIITVQYPSQLQLFISYIWRIRNSNYSQIVKSAAEKIPLQRNLSLQRNPQEYLEAKIQRAK